MKLFKLLFAIILLFSLNSCNDSDEIEEVKSSELFIQFNHEWNSAGIDLDDLKYVNANGEVISISKFKYLISNFKLHKSNETFVQFSGYMLIDLKNESISVSLPNVPFDNYTKFSFTFGFDESDNIDGEYNDLNSESWNWPTMLGGGYHFMQFEGKYLDNGNESPFAYHMGTAKVSEDVFEQNYFEVEFDGFNFTKPSTLNLTMNIAEWFVNPHTWDLNIYSINLMPNYEAQKMMNANGKTVFSLGEID